MFQQKLIGNFDHPLTLLLSLKREEIKYNSANIS